MPSSASYKKPFTFIDLFSGIGGFHQAAAACGGKCVMACDINEEARQIYDTNYGIVPEKDVRHLKHVHADLLMAGPPCQTYSTIGERKGTSDKRGTLIYTVARYIHATQPNAFIIENVKGLTVVPAFHRFIKMVTNAGYTVSWSILDAANFGVPQHRERVYIVGLRSRAKQYITPAHSISIQPFDFAPLMMLSLSSRIPFKRIMDDRQHVDIESLRNHKFDDVISANKLTDIRTSTGFILRAKKNNYINNKLFSSDGIVGTLCATFSPIIYDERYKIARQMSKSEMLLCQGFPGTFQLPGGRSKAMFYTGNAVCVNVVRAIVEHIQTIGAI